MDIVEGRTFKGQEVFMDFTVWRKCNFVNCRLIVEYGMFKIQDNDFVGCTWLFPKGTPAGLIFDIITSIQQQK